MAPTEPHPLMKPAAPAACRDVPKSTAATPEIIASAP